MDNESLPRVYKVERIDTPLASQIFCPEETFDRVLELIKMTAGRYHRQDYIEQLTEPSDLDIRIAYVEVTPGNFSYDFLKKAPRSDVMVLTIQRTIRALTRELYANIIRQTDVENVDGVRQRKIEWSWQRQHVPVPKQLKALQRAVNSADLFKLEKAWFGLVPRAMVYLSVGFHCARKSGALRNYKGKSEEMSTLIARLRLAPGLLEIILPYAVRAAGLPGRRPVHPRDEALALVLDIFNEISGLKTGSARLGGYDEPTGPGADFVRRIEKIFGVELMSKGSTHSIARAKKRMATRRD